jgi:fructosamine-3-kinase
LLPNEPPALLHGDLWIGNIMFDTLGNTVMIDPAIYFGNREAEIAFTMLFGGFDKKFYQSYKYHHPLQSGFEKRVDLYNLYPLLVHLNLFGSSYLPDILKILKSFK